MTEETFQAPLMDLLGENAYRYVRPSMLYALQRLTTEALNENLTETQIRNEVLVLVPSAYNSSTRTWQLSAIRQDVWQAADLSSECQRNWKTLEEIPHPTHDILQDCLWLTAKLAFVPRVAAEFALLLETERNRLPRRLRALGEWVQHLGKNQDIRDAWFRAYPDTNASSRWLPAPGIDLNDLIATEKEAFLIFKQAPAGASSSLSSGVAQLLSERPCAEKWSWADLVRATIDIADLLPIHRHGFWQGAVYRALSTGSKRDESFDIARVDNSSRLLPHRIRTSGTQPVAGRPPTPWVPVHTPLEPTDQFAIGSAGDVTPSDAFISLAWSVSYPLYLRRTLELGDPETWCVPIYSTWLMGEGYGFLRAHVLVTMATKGDAPVSDAQFRALLQSRELTAAEVTDAALARIAARPISTPYDLVEHFVQCLIELQDWEFIEVIGRSTGEVLYHYRRCYENDNATDATSARSPEWRRFPGPAPSRDARLMDWPAPDELDISRRDLLPDLSDSERADLSAVTLRFGFPDTAVLPRSDMAVRTREALHKRILYALIEEQVDVLRLLIPKVRARRAALRNAVSAIMGRNMSHNIGSHVLARYAPMARIETMAFMMKARKEETLVANPEVLDSRGEFLSYLQRRMDFIAEIATTDRAGWSQSLSLRDTLLTLNYDTQVLRYIGHTGPTDDPSFPILLRFVSGKDNDAGASLCTTVENAPDTGSTDSDPFFFDSPGGEVGAHALYVLIENVARNSARHSPNALPDKVVISYLCQPVGDYWKLTIFDTHTQRPLDQSPGPGPDTGPRQDTVDKVRAALGKAFLRDDNELDPANWGIREMQVCATYLRQLALTDIEGSECSPPLLQADWQRIPGGEQWILAYTLYLRRARFVAFVSNTEALPDEVALPEGFKLVVPSLLSAEELAAQVQGYQFVLYDESLSADDLLKQFIPSPQCPVRAEPMPRSWIRDRLGELCDAAQPVRDVQDWLQRHFHARTLKKILASLEHHPDPAPRSELVVHFGWNEANTPPPACVELADLTIHRAAGDPKEGPDGSCRHWDRPGGTGTLPHVAFIDHFSSPDQTFKNWYDSHSDIQFRLRSNSPDDVVPADFFWDARKRRFCFVEPFRSITPHRAALATSIQPGSAAVVEFCAAALARVLVLDERVQTEAATTVDSLRLRDRWTLARVTVPGTHAAKLDRAVWGPLRAALAQPFQEYHAPGLIDGGHHFAAVHLTILERLLRDRDFANERSLRGDEVFRGFLEQQNDEAALIYALRAAPAIGQNCHIVVVTGRGVPAFARGASPRGFAGSVRYLPVSTVLDYLIRNPSKLMLMRALWSASGAQSTLQRG